MNSPSAALADATLAEILEAGLENYEHDPTEDVPDTRRPDQMPPKGDWRIWLLHPGRGWGKGHTASHWIRDQVRAGEARSIALVGATRSAVRQLMIEGPSGVLAVCPDATYKPSRAEVEWPGGAKAFICSAEKADDPPLRGGNFDTAWADEVDSWGLQTTNQKADLAWSNLELSTRKGDARIVVTSTPKPGRQVSELLKIAKDSDSVRITTGSTYDNAKNLSPAFIAAIERRYKGTRLERQEIFGEVLSSIHGALWTPGSYQSCDIGQEDLGRVVVGVDPSGGGDEIGIVAVGEYRRSADNLAVLDDFSLHGSPKAWARRTLDLFREWKADCIVAERNFGGDMVEATIRNADPNAPVRMVTASRSKQVRAEPIALLYEQEKVWHRRGASLDLLQAEMEQMTARGYTGSDSPNRLDAMVWAATELSEGGKPGLFGL